MNEVKEAGRVYLPSPNAAPNSREMRGAVKQVRQALLEPEPAACWCGRWDGPAHVCGGFRDNAKDGIEETRYLRDLDEQAREISRLFPELRIQAELQAQQQVQQQMAVQQQEQEEGW